MNRLKTPKTIILNRQLRALKDLAAEAAVMMYRIENLQGGDCVWNDFILWLGQERKRIAEFGYTPRKSQRPRNKRLRLVK